MRVSRAQAEENRRTVIETAGRLFRERGFDGIGLSDLMREAGLTHGGFYKQFKSKDDLVQQACECVMDKSAGQVAQLVDGAGEQALAQFIGRYLDGAHRDQLGQGCIFAALGGDAARHRDSLGPSFEAGLKGYLDVIEGAMRALPEDGHRPDPITLFSTMVGALLLSRVVKDEALAATILDTARSDLLQSVAPRVESS